MEEIKFVVSCCIIVKDEILVQKRSEHSKVYPGYISIPGGKVEANEDIISAAIRETLEETGIKLSSNDLKLCFVTDSYHKYKNTRVFSLGFFIELNKKPKYKSSKEGEISFVKIKDLFKMDKLSPSVLRYKYLLLENKKGITYSSNTFESEDSFKTNSINYVE
ncbi:NUDIX hydrolase [Candidatus Dojkabacteria bacterium]|jgi:8-oxo-dGTP pyrophosphatase MutT (NUDIX family)|nr:NUDIX hydrolase [Candidatus Dojkabacteria bacterium]